MKPKEGNTLKRGDRRTDDADLGDRSAYLLPFPWLGFLN